jgi:hypothetical protein
MRQGQPMASAEGPLYGYQAGTFAGPILMWSNVPIGSFANGYAQPQR